MNSDLTFEAAIEAQAMAILSMAKLDLQACQGGSSKHTIIKGEAAETEGSSDADFDGWLPLNLANGTRYYNYNLSELKVIRDAVRVMCDTNEIAKCVQKHYRNFIVGKGIQITVVDKSETSDPVKLAASSTSGDISALQANWDMFYDYNNMTLRLHDWVTRAHRDGEVYQRLFAPTSVTLDIPVVRFVEPEYLITSSTAKYGIKFADTDAETAVAYMYKPYSDSGKDIPVKPIPAEEIVADVRNVSFGAPRGIPSYWTVMTNLRRLEKILVNSSVLAAVQAAITMVRKHTSANAAKVERMLAKQSDNQVRTDSVSGKAYQAKRYRAGTILDTTTAMDYEFPSHGINASSFVEIAKHELTHIAANFVLPVAWLMGEEPTEPLTPGSPTIAMFETEQGIIFHHLETMFWMVQALNGVDVQAKKATVELLFNGKRLAVGKALDEARVDEILQRTGAMSPQSISQKHGMTYVIERANTIKHRDTRQPDEVMPGDAGNTTANSGGGTAAGVGGDGTTKKDGGQRSADGGGRNG